MSLQFDYPAIGEEFRAKCCEERHSAVLRFDILRVTRNNADEVLPEASRVNQRPPSQSPGPGPGTDPENQESVREAVQTGTEEIGGPKGLEPTRYGDWEKNGRCIDF